MERIHIEFIIYYFDYKFNKANVKNRKSNMIFTHDSHFFEPASIVSSIRLPKIGYRIIIHNIIINKANYVYFQVNTPLIFINLYFYIFLHL